MKKLKRRLLGLLLLPFCYGVTLAFAQIVKPFREVPEGSFYFFAGILSYFAFQWAFFRPLRTYVFGHEFTHALAAWISGGSVKHFHVGKRGGSVTVSKTNFFVALAPYMIPLYALLLLGGYSLASHWLPSLRDSWRLFLWLLGGSLGFHMALTAYALKQDQPDLKPSGRLLSAVLIYLGNALSLMFLLGVLFPRTVSWKRFLTLSGQEAWTAVRHVGEGSAVVWREAGRALQ